MTWRKIITVISIFLVVISCKTEYEETDISLEDYKLVDGFELELIAAEPLLDSPVAMDFDEQGRIWVVEMNSYMANMEGLGEDEPVGTIKILEDLDEDGIMDHAVPFLDSLVLPRAISFVYDGLLYAAPPNLWFVEIADDKPVNRVLVDSMYAATGNPEHQPNGLLRNIDNWIYNAKSHFRYRRVNGEWQKEPTAFRGQWGITHDDFGRLYYNDNSRQLLGDYMLPNVLTRNPYYPPKVGVNRVLTQNQRVYPLQPTLVNRGYAPGVLDKDSKLVNVTAACGPLIYRGAAFPKDYWGNAFICVPEANLIKRQALVQRGDSLVARELWQDKEFLASYDEGFRPVNLSNGPDGAVYIVDMHKGLIGHHAYLSPYFKERVGEHRLEKIVGQGRILKITPKGHQTQAVTGFSNYDSAALVDLLSHDNGWVRSRAQHHLISKKHRGAVPRLKEMLFDTTSKWAPLHALYTLEGLGALSPKILFEILHGASAILKPHALALLDRYAGPDNIVEYKAAIRPMTKAEYHDLHPYVAASLGTWAPFAKKDLIPLMVDLYTAAPIRPLVREALVSGALDVMDTFGRALANQGSEVLYQDGHYLALAEDRKAADKKTRIYVSEGLQEDGRTKGGKLYRKICATCHGINGGGNEGLAPPLKGSEYVAKPLQRLGMIMLHGLKGPVTVSGKEYNFNQAMPGLRGNKTLTDADIAAIVQYVSNAFANEPDRLTAEEINALRSKGPKDGTEFTEAELLAIPVDDD